MKKQIAKRWQPEPGIVACYTGTSSRLMRRHHRVKVFAEACGRRLIVQVLNFGKSTGRFVVVKAKNIAPIQADLFY